MTRYEQPGDFSSVVLEHLLSQCLSFYKIIFVLVYLALSNSISP